MSSISVSDTTKAEFDSLKPDSQTHDEFISELLAVYRTFEGEPVDHEQLAKELEQSLIPMTEVAAFRGTKEAIEANE